MVVLIDYFSGYTKIFVLGGYHTNLGHVHSVEVIDLENRTNVCNGVANYPVNEYEMTVGLVDGLIKSCGSYYDTAECYDYDPVTNSWIISVSMLNERDAPRSSFIDGVWLVSGDYNETEDVSQSTGMWTGRGFENGPTLPRKMFYHCQLTVNSTHVFFADTWDSGTAYLYDWHRQTWTELPPMIRDRNHPSCGLINNPENGLEVVILEDAISEIFNFNDLSWRTGPPVMSISDAGFTQLGDTFVVVGGIGGWDPYPDDLDRIYMFDHINYDWIYLSNLQDARYYPGVVAVPDDFITCS